VARWRREQEHRPLTSCRAWPGRYEALCGPRTEKELKEGSVLQQLGYTTSMVAKM